MRKPKRAYKYCILRVLQKFMCLYISQIQLPPEQNRALTKKDADSRVLRNSLTGLSPFPFKACSERIIDFHFLSAHRAKFSCKKFWPPFYFAGFDASRWGVGTGKTANSQRARSIQPKFQPVRPGKLVHLKKWTRFFETFPVGLNRSIEFWTEISRNFG